MKHVNNVLNYNRPNTNNSELLGAAEQYGIYFDRILPVMFDEKGTSFKSTIGMDADTFTYGAQSNGIPFEALTEYARTVIEQIQFRRAYTTIGSPYQAGDFTTKHTMIPIRNNYGSVSVYGDYSEDGLSSANYTYLVLDSFQAQTMVGYGELEVEALSKAKISAITDNNYVATQNISIAQNNLFFFGNVSSAGAFYTKTYGLLNNPMLNPAMTTTVTGGWYKAFMTNNPNAILNDITTAFTALSKQLGTNIKQDSRMTMCIDVGAAALFGATTTLGITLASQIKSVYPNLNIVYAPEYATLNQSAPATNGLGGFQLIAEDIANYNTVNDAFAYKFRDHGTIKMTSSWKSKKSFSSFGCFLPYTAAIVTVVGL